MRQRYAEDKTRCYVKGKRVRLGNPKHPFHAFYTKHGMDATIDAMGLGGVKTVPGIVKASDTLFETVKEGDVYIMRNPAWPEWVKVGMAIDATDRAKNYQTYTPFADFKVSFKKRFKDRYVAEKAAHKELTRYPSRGEWFRCTIAQAKEIIEGVSNGLDS